MKLNPPKKALDFLRWFCHQDHIEEIEGNLIELFHNQQNRGHSNINWRFYKNTLLHFRPEYLRPILGFNLANNYDMLRNYFKIATRNLTKNGAFSIIHILGLAIGTAACLLIFQYIQFERSFDKFHDQAENIYRVPIRYSDGFSPFPKTAANHPALGPAMVRDFPEVKSFARFMDPINMGAKISLTHVNDQGRRATFIEEQIYLADSSFMDIFSFDLISGNSTNALKKPNSIAITSTLAKKYFGNADPLGKTMFLNGRDDSKLTVTAVLKDIPAHSHLQFDALFSFQTMLSSDFADNSWVWPEFYTYVLLQPDANVAALESKFPALTERYMAEIHKEHNFKTYFSLQPLLDIHLKSDCANEPSEPGSERMVYFLTLLGVFILSIAWVNYINLSTSKSIERAREVGVRKVVGANRFQLMGQFFTETIILNGLSILLGMLIARSSLPIFAEIVGKDIGDSLLNYTLLTEPNFWSIFLGSVFFGGILVGLYPALILSSFKPVKVLRGRLHKSSQNLSFRKVLVGFQFVLSILLIAATILVTRQISYMNREELGYTKDQIMVVKAPVIADSISYLKTQALFSELTKIPSVLDLAKTSEIPGKLIAFRSETRKRGQTKEYNTPTYLKRADDHFVTTFDIPMVAGRNFRQADSSRIYDADNNKVMINEKLAKAYGYTSSEEAIGKEILFKLGQNDHKAAVVGVVKNYHQRSLREEYDQILYYFPSWDSWTYYSLKIQTNDWNQSIRDIEETYKSIYADNSLEYFFLDEFFDRQYRAEQQFSKVCKLIAALAIFVAILGFIGLSALILGQRTKEIGVRKILGATPSNVLLLLTNDFFKMILIANVIALPVVLYFGKEWLNAFAFNVGLGWQIFILPILFLISIVLIIVGVQIYRTSILNPVLALRDE